MTERLLEAAAFLAASGAAGWAALACRRARSHGRPGADGRAWAVVSVLFLALAASRAIQAGPWLGGELRRLARANGLYSGRRPFQIAATLGLAALAVGALAVGLRALWEVLKRYRLAASCIAVIGASAAIRFVSLHEVDAWNRQWPWVRVSIDLGTSALAMAAALARVRQTRTAA